MSITDLFIAKGNHTDIAVGALLALKSTVPWPKVKLHAKYKQTSRKPMIRLKKKVNHRAKKGRQRFTLWVRKGQVTCRHQGSLALMTSIKGARSSVGRASDF